MNGNRLVVALFGAAVAAVVAYLVYSFIAAVTVAIFLYYSTRRVYRFLGRVWVPRRVRAAAVISLIAVPLLLLLSYTLVLVVMELRHAVEEYPAIESTVVSLVWFVGLEQLPDLTLEGLLGSYRAGELDGLIDFATEHATIVTGMLTAFALNLLLVVVLTYYLLVDGYRARSWLLRFDEDAIVREYLEAADRELEAVLFGNLLNVIAIALVAVVTFTAYNMVAPVGAAVPYPTLAGALTGVASLIPVVGMKVVYVPLGSAATVPILSGGDPTLLLYIAVFFALAFVVVDTIPDLILRPYLSGETTHVGLLLLAYIVGPVVFGFYGLFLAPIVLVLGLTFANTALPELLEADGDGGPPHDQRRLDEF